MSTQNLLIELGTEELPPKALKKLQDAFHAEIQAGLKEAQLVSAEDAAKAKPYASPRRLAVWIPNVANAQADQSTERRGPAVQAAFDADGNATPAAMGFAKSCGVEVDQLDRLKTDKGEWLSYTVEEKGKSLDVLIEDIIERANKRLPIPKRMRWGDSSAEFVRPVKWLLVLFGDKVLPCHILDVDSGNISRGHRFHSKGEITINHADEYAKVLLEEGRVIADFSERQAMIQQQINQAAASVNGNSVEDPALLDEVTGLVEYPSPIVGNFDQAFLDVPQECLISSMRDHQKYFHIVDENGALLPHFITLSNIESSNPEQVKTGNEKVLRARLSDAQFFWETDQKIKLADRVDRLSGVTFHHALGSVLDKTKRLEQLASKLAADLGADQDLAARGAHLCKADLVSDMVGEFDELQGIMGHYYADREGENPIVGECIEQHYWPKFAGDDLPKSTEAQAVALADKLDSLVGIYNAGEVPTGDKDPYGLRRSALSILRILIEQQHDLGLSQLVAISAEVYSDTQGIEIDAESQSNIVAFVRGRLLAFYQAQGIATNTIKSVLACEPDSPLDFDHRVKAIAKFSDLEEADDLAAANKRIANILKKLEGDVASDIDANTLAEAAEQNLYKALVEVEEQCQALFQAGDYQSALELLAKLRTPVDTFFDQVMVMSDDQQQKQNRLALLVRLRAMFMQVADISLLQA